MLSDAPPSRDDVTISCTCRESIEVNTFTSSGITAPARVPHEIMVASFHHKLPSPPSSGTMKREITYVSAIEMMEVSHTSEVSGASKFICCFPAYRALAQAAFRK